MKDTKLIKYPNGICVKTTNRRILVEREVSDRNCITFVSVLENKSDIKLPACEFEVIKGKVGVTRIALSDVGIEALHLALSKYLSEKYLIK